MARRAVRRTGGAGVRMRTAGGDANLFSVRAVGFRSRRDRSRLQRTRADAVLHLEARNVINGIRVAQELDGVELQVITVGADVRAHLEHAIEESSLLKLG